MAELHSILDEFICSPECPVCLGEGIVCEEHDDRPWGDGDGCCGAAGMPCPSIAKAREAFVASGGYCKPFDPRDRDDRL